ncbi:MAG: hypothetical protein M9962_11785 [Oligoflexia bacterium]|nr:hypothetical protein [Oligoflexia bacterium]
MSKVKSKKSNPLLSELEEFFSSKIAINAASGLSGRAIIEIHLDDQVVFFQKVAGKNQLHEKIRDTPDLVFWINKGAMQKILACAKKKDVSIAKMGICVFEQIFSRDESSKIYFRVDAGFLALWTKGYFSVLKLGGPEVAAYIAGKGFGSLGKIKDALKAMRRPG